MGIETNSTDWLAANEAALDYIATRIAPKFGVLDRGIFDCAESAAEISPGWLVAPKLGEGGSEPTLGQRPTK